MAKGSYGFLVGEKIITIKCRTLESQEYSCEKGGSKKA